MRKVLTVSSIVLALIPAAWFTFLLAEGRGSTALKIALVIAFVLLAIGGPILLALIYAGIEKGEGELRIRDWVVGRAKVEVRDPKDRAPDDKDSEN